MHGEIAFLGYYEKKLSETIARIGREVGGRFVDIGANIGYYSLIWVAQSPENDAIAIEPSPQVQSLLRGNIERNGFGKRIEVVEAAAGKENGEVKFNMGPEDETGWGGVTDNEEGEVKEESEGTVRVAQRRLDEFVEGPISLLKADVEGAEKWVFRGAEDLLRSQKIERICFENNCVRAQRLGIGEQEPIELLERFEYEVFDRGYTLWAEPRG